jgi:hypothetical protein
MACLFAFISPILLFVFNLPASRLCDFAICCKGCGQNVPAPVGTMPDTWIVAKCLLCGEKRRYLPSEIFKGQAVAPAWTETCKVSGVSLMGELKRGEAWEEQRRVQDRYASTLVIAAAIIAAVRLAREQDISRPSPRLRVWLAP